MTDTYQDRTSQNGLQDVDKDQSIPRLGDVRKTKLTLREINKIRRMIDIRNYEMREKLKKVAKIYGSTGGEEGPMM